MTLYLRLVLLVLIVAHVCFFLLEWFWLDLPSFQAKLGFVGAQDEVAIVGKNQAFSNLVLAAGLVFGWITTSRGKAGGRDILLFFYVSILLAGIIGFGTIKGDKLPFLFLQVLPAALGIYLTVVQKTEKMETTRS